MVAMERVFDPVVQGWVVKVLPGQWRVAEAGTQLAATTASCVCLMVWDQAGGRAAMAHFMVEPGASEAWNGAALPSPHADALLEKMWQGLQAPGGGRPAYSACVAGGGNVLLHGRLTLGQPNVMKAVDWLHQRKVPLRHYDVGESIFRRVYFDPASGEAHIRRMAVSRNDTVRAREEHYRDYLAQKPTQQEGQVA